MLASVVVETSPVTDHASGMLDRLEPLPMHALLFQGTDHAIKPRGTADTLGRLNQRPQDTRRAGTPISPRANDSAPPHYSLSFWMRHGAAVELEASDRKINAPSPKRPPEPRRSTVLTN